MVDLPNNDMLVMSDEDFLELNEPPVADAAGETSPTNQAEQGETAAAEESGEAETTTAAEGEAGSDETADKASNESKPDADGSAETGDNDKSADVTGTDPAGKSVAGTKDEKGDPSSTGSEDKSKAEEAAPNYQGFYEQIMKPFKANGKTIELKTPEEAIQLMQMGANYTRKMQDLQPHRKTLMMLENNGIDQDKLSYLIDLDKKNPEAIKKLIKDSGIDPMEIDTTTDPAYFGGAHKVTDEDAAFKTAIEEVGSSDEGRETLVEINTKWDSDSKAAIYKDPRILGVIQEQRESGVYAVIADEIERRKMLGTIPTTTSFLESYYAVGAELSAQATKTQEPPAKAEPQVLAERAATPKKNVEADAAAAAASPTRTSGKTAKTVINPLEMADDEFLKQFEGRL